MQTIANKPKKPTNPRSKGKKLPKTPPPPVRPSTTIAIATCRFCGQELLFDNLLRRFVGLRRNVESRPCQHLVAAGVEEKISTHVMGREITRDSTFVWFAGKTRQIVYRRSLAGFLAARIESSLMYGRALERWADVQAIRETLPTEQLGVDEVACAADMAVAVVFARDPKKFLERFEQKNRGALDAFVSEKDK